MSSKTSKGKRKKPASNGPLKDIDEWQDVKAEEYKKKQKDSEETKANGHHKKGDEEAATTTTDGAKEAILVGAEGAAKRKEQFRNYKDSKRQERVSKFYKEQHNQMTMEFVEGMEKKWTQFDHGEMGIWEALEMLNSLVDDSDPDTDLSQLQHALQTAEAIRKEFGEDHDWMALTGLIHDLGKVMAMKWKEPQWCVVGDTFPVGCQFDSSNVFAEYFKENPDAQNPKYNTKNGIYSEGCGLFNVHMSWGHDEYLYRVCVHNKTTLPLAALYMIRYHSFYPWHREGGYAHLMDAQDKENFEWVKKFNPFDLYSKANEACDVEKLKPYYMGLIKKYFPDKLKW